MRQIHPYSSCFLCAVSILALSWPAASQRPLDPMEPPRRVGVGPTKQELSLTDAIERALKSNLEIEVERTNIEAAQENLAGARGWLDPRFRLQPRVEDRKTPTASPLLGAEGKLKQTIGTLSGSYDQRLPWWGSALNVALENSRQTTSNPFEGLSPFNTVRFGANVTIPLRRNRELDRERANLLISSKQIDVTDNQFRLRVIDVIRRVQEGYWNLVAARQNVRVTAEAVKLAQEQLARTRRQIESGTLAEVELAAAEAELERRIDTWYASVGLVTDVENVLKLLIAAGHEDDLWNDELIPIEQRNLEPLEYPNIRDAVDVALRKRPELRVIELQTETNGIQQSLARSQTKTQVNALGGVSFAGLTGSVTAAENPFSRVLGAQFVRINELSVLAGLDPLSPFDFGSPPDFLFGSYGQMWEQVFRGRFPTVYAGIQFEFTGRNRAAEAELAKTAIQERRLDLQRRQLEQSIGAEVRNSLQAIQTARQRITAAEASVRAAEEKLASEIRLFQSGESTNFLVLTRQNELADSRQRAVVARLDFNKAVARAQQALGTLLETYNIILDK